ncbi:efflux RND transporter permease subunit [Hydrogenophaga sp. 5NK40-0174]|uniref:efflux RND transporter permease subunit n=1 Tax=Hydrogenophaga sp. 5NK40-0174 TaxID=3127649 RepID=UPI003108DBE3
MSRFFIDRPIFAWVISIVIMLAGALSIMQLPLEQYPDIAPTRISVSSTYTGASAQTVEDSVTQVIEQKMQGLDGLQSMSSESTSAGRARVSLSFVAGTDPDVAQMQVQNKVQQALTQLPESVQDQGVTVTKSGTDFLMIATFTSDDPNVKSVDIGDYVATSLQDTISRIDGVGEVQAFGSGYAMRIWLDPAKLERYSLMPSDVISAIQAQNAQVSAGQVGALPASPGQQLNAVITARSKLRSVDEFNEIVVKSASNGAIVRLADVARVELGQESYTVQTRYNGQASSGMGIRLASGANAMAVANAVKAKLAELAPFFPNQIEYSIAYDTTPFVKVSVEEVVITLAEAMVLVVLIMGIFLQSWRATLIPAIAVPVVLLGTFGVLAVAGYSINTLVLFGMVLAIGLLVDDAIVVVENVERVMHEEGLPPREATRKSMGEITPALVGISLVLSAVFIPMAFFGGSTGVIYRQFSITIVAAMTLSVLVALTLTPALCASLLRPPAGMKPRGRIGAVLQRFFGAFNHGFDRGSSGYRSTVHSALGRSGRMLVIYAALVAGLAFSFTRLPTSFLPDEDQGMLMAMVKMPAGTTDSRLDATMKGVEDHLREQPEVVGVMALRGLDGDQASGRMFIKLKDWSERTGHGQNAKALVGRLNRELSITRDAQVFVMLPPAVRGLGSNAGFTLELQDLGGVGQQALSQAKETLIAKANEDSRLSAVRASGLPPSAEIEIGIDDRKASALGLSTASINSTLSAAMGGSYVNDFINKSRVKKVYVQADAPYRMTPDDILRWTVRNSAGDMVPFSAFATVGWASGPAKLERYSGLSSYEIVGNAAEGVSSGEAMDAMEALIATLPQGISYQWAGQSYQERLSGNQAPMLYAISILFVFLCLAALYESWSIPFSVMLVVPLGVIGAVLATWVTGLSNDVYFQIGLLTTVGLSAKNAILIVEFAQQLEQQGVRLVDATLQAVKQRLRPILMTSLAFGFGVLPLALASGAGSASRQAIGTGVLGGMITATVLGLVFVPVFYVTIRQLFGKRHAANEGGEGKPDDNAPVIAAQAI